MTLSMLRHDIRNHLNTIKLSSALLQRRYKDDLSDESLREVDRSADAINDLITHYLGEADTPALRPRKEEAMRR
jgi:nitrogen fixation/metabolism regulation signal transduction histidine kinase